MINKIEDIPDLKKEVPLAPYTTWKIGGPAEYFWEPDREHLPKVLRFCDEEGIPVRFLGRGSNTLVDDEGVDGLVVCTKNSLQNIDVEKEVITAEAGVPMPNLARYAAQLGHGGYEFLIGIPGTIGGGIAINAGLTAHGRREIRGILVDAELVDMEGNVLTQRADDLDLGYRSSNIPDRNLFVLSGRFKYKSKEEPENILERCSSILEERKGKQPLTYPTAGSVFKQPEGGRAAGWYLDEAGLKGHQIGGARVSEKHANWIINVDDASSRDVENLMEHMAERVYEEFGIRLEREVIVMS